MELITQLKSWLDIEPSVGCPNKCAYCHRISDGDFYLTKPKATILIERLFLKLQKHPLFIPNETHLSINGIMSDAFLAENKNRTFRFLRLLEKANYKNWVTIITKAFISKNDAKILKKFKNIKPVIFVTYSEMPSFIERVPNSQRIKSLKNLKQAGVKCVLYWRPLVKNVNDSSKKLDKILNIGQRYADAFVLSGLRLTEKNRIYLEGKGVNLANENWHPDHKIISTSTKERIFRKYQEKKCKTPLFLKSSCAVSFFETKPDFNAHWSKIEKNCSPFCPREQKIRCKKQSLKNLSTLARRRLINLSREEKTFFRQKYRLPIN